jgi:hypothetical protein
VQLGVTVLLLLLLGVRAQHMGTSGSGLMMLTRVMQGPAEASV